MLIFHIYVNVYQREIPLLGRNVALVLKLDIATWSFFSKSFAFRGTTCTWAWGLKGKPPPIPAWLGMEKVPPKRMYNIV
jgi:hypothetical protein